MDKRHNRAGGAGKSFAILPLHLVPTNAFAIEVLNSNKDANAVMPIYFSSSFFLPDYRNYDPGKATVKLAAKKEGMSRAG